MVTRVMQENDKKRAYGRVEQFQMMSQKNPVLQKMKEAFGLELD